MDREGRAMSAFFLLAACLLLAVADSQGAAPDEYKFVAYLEVQGTCIEDRVQLSPGDASRGYATPGYDAVYSGDIVHWLNVKNNVHVIHGTVYDNLAHDRIVPRLEYPNRYPPPFAIEFVQVDARRIVGDTLRLHGISDHSSGKTDAKGPRYSATCTLKVVRRLFYIPDLGTELGIRLTRERELLKKGNRQ